MKTKNALQFPSTLRELYSHQDFTPFGSSSDDWINDPDRMSRCQDAVEDGGDGSFHAEIIEDWRGFLSRLRDEALRACAWHDRVEAEIERRCEAIETEIDACEQWHENNGSLWQQIG